MNKHHKYFELNKEGRDFVIGDLHGCYDVFMNTLKTVDFNYLTDRMFSVGDIIDRGPESRKCLYLLKMPWFHMVLGNHEDMMISAVKYDQGIDMWLRNGGRWIFDVEDIYKQEMCAILEDLPHAITVETEWGPIGICHAQPPTNYWTDTENPTFRQRQNMLWTRDRLGSNNTEIVNEVVKVYCGHTTVKTPKMLGNVDFIDTGCHYSSILTIKRIN